MKYFYRFTFILIPIFMIGCPLVSDFPLGESRNAPMNQGYIGKWMVVPKSSEEDAKDYLWILPFNENEYYLEAHDYDKGNIYRYRGYITVIDNVNILNVQIITNDENKIVYIPEREYYFLKIMLTDNNVIKFWNLESNGIERSHSKEELLQYVKENIRKDKLYDYFGEFKRHVEN